MKETFKRVKGDMILSAVLCLALGIVLLFWPGTTINLVCKALAVGLMILGGVQIATYFGNKQVHTFSGALGLIVFLVGVWVFLKPSSIVSLVPIVIGVILAIHGVQDLKIGLETRKGGYEQWWKMVIVALINLIFGILCIVNAFGMVKLAMQFVGVALIYDGVTDVWVATKAVRIMNAMKKEAEALEVEYREVEPETADPVQPEENHTDEI